MTPHPASSPRHGAPGPQPGTPGARGRRSAEDLLAEWRARGEVVGYIAEQWTPCPTGPACAHTACTGSWDEIESCFGIYGIDDALAQGRAAIAA